MPFTVFHIGAGALVKAIAPARVSWSAFALANAAVDLEPIYFFIRYHDPAHRFFHTFLGAALMGSLCAIAGRLLCEALLRAWNRKLSPAQARWLGTATTIPRPSMWVGALLGAWSHVGLDALMHYDVAPLAPWRAGNPLLETASLEALHGGCAAAMGAGIALLLARRWRALRL